MLVCLSCPKQAAAHQQHPSHKLPSNPRPQPIKSFTTQLKDIVLKFSTGAYRHCRPCTADQSSDAHDQRHDDDDDEEERSSILKRAPSEASSDARSPPTHVQKCDESTPSRYDLLPLHRRRRHRSHRRRSDQPYLRSHSSSKSASFTGTATRFSNSQELKLENSACPDGVSGHQFQAEPGQFFAHGSGSPRESSEEWVAQVEPGIMITLVALPDGSNHLKRIRFSQELFDKWQAQLWWAENSDMVHELYSLTRNQAPCESPTSSCSTSSCHEAALRNTPEMLSRANSTLNSPCRSSDYNISLSFPTTLKESTFSILSMNYDDPFPSVEAGCSTSDNPSQVLSQCDHEGHPHSNLTSLEAGSPELGLSPSTEPRSAVCDDDRPRTHFSSYAQFNDRPKAPLAFFTEFDLPSGAHITSSEEGSCSRLPLSPSTGNSGGCHVISEGGSSSAATGEAAASAKCVDHFSARDACDSQSSGKCDGLELFSSIESLQGDDRPRARAASPRSPSPAHW